MKPHSSALLGQKVGHIRVVDVLGEGGMGAVYVGFDDTLQRKVALKAIRSEFRLSEEARARFLREARILSQLDHPYVCTVFDYLEEDECDFLVMELVEGRSLRETMAEDFDHKQKLEIAHQLLEVLVAVHGAGVIHRDLKPENIMVLPSGAIKVLDFGLSRSVEEEEAVSSTVVTIGLGDSVADGVETDETMGVEQSSQSVYVKTKLGTVLGTLGYMSPEQARGEPATAASDMYSLGLILQELFTGGPPFEAGLEADVLLARAAEGKTRAVSGLPADLGVLIDRLKSVAPGARPSALDAAEHLQHIVDGPKRRRKRALTATIWLILTSLCAALAFQTVRAMHGERRAEQERRRAEHQAEVADGTVTFLTGLFNAMNPYDGGRHDINGREILDLGEEKLATSFLDEPLLRARIMDALAGVYYFLGDYSKAAPLAEEALRLRREHLPEDHLDLAESIYGLANLLGSTGDYERAEVLAREALVMRRSLLGDEHLDVAESLFTLSGVLLYKGDLEEGEVLAREALAMFRRLRGDDHPDVARTLNNVALVLQAKGDLGGAEHLFRQALAMKRRLLGSHPNVAANMLNLASVLSFKGETEEAEALIREALEMFRQLLGDENPFVANGLDSMASVLTFKGDLEEAEALCREALAMRRRILGNRHPDVSKSLVTLATLLQTKGNSDGAEALFREALAMHRQLVGNEHPYVARSLDNLALLLFDKEDYSSAEPLLREALEIRRRFHGNEHADVADNLNFLGVVLMKKGDDAAAEPMLCDALSMQRRLLGERHPDLSVTLHNLAYLLHQRGDYAEAEVLYRESLAIAAEARPPNRPFLSKVQSRYASFLRETGRDAEAEELEARGAQE